MVSIPRISKGPAGCRINRDSERRGWATRAETGHPNWGPRETRTRGSARVFGNHVVTFIYVCLLL